MNNIIYNPSPLYRLAIKPAGVPFSKFVILICMLFFSASCTEEIDWDVPGSAPRIIVEGRVDNELKHQYVRLQMSQNLFEEKGNKSINHARITVNDGDQIFDYEEDPNEGGLYKSIQPFAGEIGRTYTIDIFLPEPIDGIQHLETSALMPHVLEFDSIQIRKEMFFNQESYTVRAFSEKAPMAPNYYLIQVYRNDILLTEEVSDYLLLGVDGDQVDDFQINDLPIYRNEDITEGDIISVKVQSLTKGYYTFLSHMVSAIRGNGMLGLSGPPANAYGNFGREVMGYFYAAPVSRVSGIAD